jgi:hypothetical protein
MYKNENQRLSTIIDDLKIAETRALSQHEIDIKNQSNEQTTRLLREEEIKWYQRFNLTLSWSRHQYTILPNDRQWATQEEVYF